MSRSFKVHAITGHWPERKKRYSSTLSLSSALYGASGQRHGPVALPPGKTRYPLYMRQSGPRSRFGLSVENLAPTEIRSPDCPARGQSLHRLSYPLIKSRRFNFSYVSYFSLKVTNFQEAFTITIPFSIIFLSCSIYRATQENGNFKKKNQQKLKKSKKKKLLTEIEPVQLAF